MPDTPGDRDHPGDHAIEDRIAAVLYELREHLLQDLLATSWLIGRECIEAAPSAERRERIEELRRALAADVDRLYATIEALDASRRTHPDVPLDIGPTREGQLTAM